jgi:tripartite-type tricarboxylate transporter receptor subunit TctC
MRFPRRTFLRLAGTATVISAFSRLARAQFYPSRPITMIVPFPAGGPTDVVGRVLAERMGGSLGQPIIIENIAGAEGSIGLGRAARARADGYTIDLGSNSAHVLNGALLSLEYDVLNDFAPILPLVTAPYILFGRKTMPAANLKEPYEFQGSRSLSESWQFSGAGQVVCDPTPIPADELQRTFDWLKSWDMLEETNSPRDLIAAQ